MFQPPAKGITVELPYRSLVLRADPEFEYKNKHQLFYEFSNGRVFLEDENQHGAYLSSGPASVTLSGVGAAGSAGLIIQMSPHLFGVGGVGAATHVTGIGTEDDVALHSVTAIGSAGTIVIETSELIPVIDGNPVGSVFATLSVTGGTGSYTYSFTNDPFGFAILDDHILIDDYVPLGSGILEVQANNGSADIVNLAIPYDCVQSPHNWIPGLRPFITSSPCNTLLAAGKTYTPVAWPASTGFNYFTGVKFYFDIPALDETTVVSWLAPESWGNPTQIVNEVMTPGFTGQTGLSGVSDGDNEAVLITGTATLNIYNFTRTSDTTGSSGAYAFDNLITGTGFGTFPTPGAGIVAAGSNLMMGCLIKEEFTRYGEFNHWISFSMIHTLTDSGFLPPAIAGDGPGGAGVLFKTGQLLAIPKATAMPGGLSIYGQAMFRAMQNYGAWPMDTGGSVTPYMACLFDPDNAGGSIPYAATTSWTLADKGLLIADVNILFPLLCAVS